MPRLSALILMLVAVLIIAPAFAMRPPLRASTSAEGMPHDRVMRIRSHQHGFIWFATVDGLARFDGRRFMRFGREHGLDDTANCWWVASRVGPP